MKTLEFSINLIVPDIHAHRAQAWLMEKLAAVESEEPAWTTRVQRVGRDPHRLTYVGGVDATVNEYKYTTTVLCVDMDEADKVMCERLGPDEDYGFPYRVSWSPEQGSH